MKQRQPLCSEKMRAILDDDQHGILGVTHKCLIRQVAHNVEGGIGRVRQHCSARGTTHCSRRGDDEAGILIGGSDDEPAKVDVGTKR